MQWSKARVNAKGALDLEAQEQVEQLSEVTPWYGGTQKPQKIQRFDVRPSVRLWSGGKSADVESRKRIV